MAEQGGEETSESQLRATRRTPFFLPPRTHRQSLAHFLSPLLPLVQEHVLVDSLLRDVVGSDAGRVGSVKERRIEDGIDGLVILVVHRLKEGDGDGIERGGRSGVVDSGHRFEWVLKRVDDGGGERVEMAVGGEEGEEAKL